MKTVYTLGMVILLALLTTFGAAAQDAIPETIRVSGVGTATGAPDLATVEIGVENVDADIQVAFEQTNNTIQTVIDQIVAVGIAREDVRTVGLSIYTSEDYPMPMAVDSKSPSSSEMQRRYHVSNRVRVVVRDMALLEAVIATAIDAGANNIFGPDLGFADRAELESEARENAMTNARERAAELAELAGVELGDITLIEEAVTGFGPFDVYNMAMGGKGMGGASAVIEPGQLSVTVQLEVTFRMSR